MVGLDLDVDGDGQAVLAGHAARLGEDWPDTLTVRTPSGGVHLYFRAPTAAPLPAAPEVGRRSAGHRRPQSRPAQRRVSHRARVHRGQQALRHHPRRSDPRTSRVDRNPAHHHPGMKSEPATRCSRRSRPGCQ
ncbi:bifunctional DNA primase/polymerase [Streptomyces sp. DH10]|nr:bifunctional DNA primase/polymerase [Streptomyces sp. DH10]MDG9709593.1 bifunctional DNA primase/polymerase [Streptomyces sp. DH10]